MTYERCNQPVLSVEFVTGHAKTIPEIPNHQVKSEPIHCMSIAYLAVTGLTKSNKQAWYNSEKNEAEHHSTVC